MTNLWREFTRDESGATAIEYGLIAEPEGPSFISRTVAPRRLDRRYS